METTVFHHARLPSDLSVREELGGQIIGPAQTLTNTWLNVGSRPERVQSKPPLWLHVSQVVFLSFISLHPEWRLSKLHSVRR